uniref:Innexin n=1 Tax=Panagrolaimus davidi TaxID=227884 RepID=A0A914NXZ3_9BILA
MLALLEFFDFIKHRHHDHDGVDNLNTRYICMYALAIGFLLFASEYGVNSIQCFDKASWRPSWKQYSDDLCFIEGSYFVNLTETDKLPAPDELKNLKKVSFYQWTPFIFVLIAFMFHLPRVFWASVNSTSYLYFQELCETSLEYEEKEHRECVKKFDTVSTSQPPRMPAHFGIGFVNRFYNEKISDKYLIISYFIVKFWHIFNVVVAHLLLCLFIGDNIQDPFGYKTFFNVISGVDWRKSGAFPRLTTCLVQIRQYDFGRFDRYKREQVQCFLAANNYIEKIFIFTWALFAFLFIRNCWSLIEWARKIWKSKSYVCEIVRARLSEKKKNNFEKNIEEYANILLPDARFAILMASSQTRDFVGGADLTANFIKWDTSRNGSA